ncbi:basic helix-loop-helix transcription factor hes-related [Holotrichia oblita]|uniref:Basic helix-loop-helix transcription factor hes-related n=1 Tax=Holotrichia oblita TaxID=644536 RepID=A0ACB9T1H5_HOLOL|nr:basic helix-loop-helix transcription factor hes-related [Holotrichia oblita]
MKAESAKRTNGVVSESRKIRKPLMEKKRRARINDSLETLKQILLESKTTIKDPSSTIKKSGQRTAKLEKADILEMTVRYLQHLRNKINQISNDTLIKTPIRIKEEIQVSPADSSCDIKYGVALVPARLPNGTIAFVVPTNSPDGKLVRSCALRRVNDLESGQHVWRPW